MNHKLNDSLKHTNCVHIFPNFFQIRFIIQVPTHLQLTRPLPAPPPPYTDPTLEMTRSTTALMNEDPMEVLRLRKANKKLREQVVALLQAVRYQELFHYKWKEEEAKNTDLQAELTEMTGDRDAYVRMYMREFCRRRSPSPHRRRSQSPRRRRSPSPVSHRPSPLRRRRRSLSPRRRRSPSPRPRWNGHRYSPSPQRYSPSLPRYSPSPPSSPPRGSSLRRSYAENPLVIPQRIDSDTESEYDRERAHGPM